MYEFFLTLLNVSWAYGEELWFRLLAPHTTIAGYSALLLDRLQCLMPTFDGSDDVFRIGVLDERLGLLVVSLDMISMISAVLTRSTGQQHHPCSPDVLLQAVSIGDDRCQSLTIGQVHEQSKVPSHDEGITRQGYKRNLMLQMIHYDCGWLMAGSKELSVSGMPDCLVPTLAKMGQDRGVQQAYCSAAIVTLTQRLDGGDPIRFATTQIGGGRTTIRVTNQSAATARREAARHRVSLSSFVVTALLEHEGT